MGIAVGSPFHTPEESPRPPLSVFQERLPVDDGQLHILTCAGVGDNLWVISKLWSVCQKRDVTFWLAAEEQKRSGDLFRMCGLRYGYMPGLTTNWIWNRPGSTPIPDTGAVISVAINRHLEHGHRIEKWYPDLQYRNPVDFISNHEVSFKQEAGTPKYVVGFMSSLNYMEYGGNLKPAQWARIWRQVEKDVAPVAIIAAGEDVKFCEEVMKYFDPSIAPIFNAPLDTVMTAMAGAEMCIGAHAGPLILATYMGIPTIQAMPRWLWPMFGSWEPEDAIYGGCFLDELENFVRDGIRFDGNNQKERMWEDSKPKIYALWDTEEKWKKDRPMPVKVYCFVAGCLDNSTVRADYGDDETYYSCDEHVPHLPRGFFKIERIVPHDTASEDISGCGESAENQERVPPVDDKTIRDNHAGRTTPMVGDETANVEVVSFGG